MAPADLGEALVHPGLGVCRDLRGLMPPIPTSQDAVKLLVDRGPGPLHTTTAASGPSIAMVDDEKPACR